MSHGNVERLRRGYEAWDRGDLDATFEFIDPDFEFHEDPLFPEAAVFHGRDAVRRYFEGFWEEWEDVRVQLEDVLECGDDRLLAFVRVRARGRGSGVEVDMGLAHLWTARDGMAVRMDAFFDRARAREAAGLSE